jgi:hypothetical protein
MRNRVFRLKIEDAPKYFNYLFGKGITFTVKPYVGLGYVDVTTPFELATIDFPYEGWLLHVSQAPMHS